jgi:hypothetical protein
MLICSEVLAWDIGEHIQYWLHYSECYYHDYEFSSMNRVLEPIS